MNPTSQEPGRFGPGRGPGGRMGRGGMGSRGYGSIVDVGSALVGLTPARELIAFEPQGGVYRELARYKIADGSTYTYPVPAGNAIYIKDQDAVAMRSVERPCTENADPTTSRLALA